MTPALLPFQRRFLRAAFAPGVEIAALCLPRAQGKSTLAAHLLARSLTPGDSLFCAGADNKLVAGSFAQARVVFRVLRADLGEFGYRYENSNQSIKAEHDATRTRVTIHGANARTLYGFLGVRLLVVDEPAAVTDDMWAAIATSAGKTRMLILCVGTIAPASKPHWWPELIARGCRPGVHVSLLQGERATWDRWPTIRRANPLVAVNPILRQTLLRERDAARRDERLRAIFLSLRLNLPTGDAGTELIATHEWERMLSRPVAARDGAAVLGIDLGASRSWSAATLMWKNGRVECYASVPGVPSLADQERRDGLPKGILQELVDTGVMAVAHGQRVADIDVLLDRLPDVAYEAVVADRFALMTLADAVAARGLPDPEFLTNQWSTASEAIAAFRRAVLDGPMTLATGRLLATLSVSHARVEPDTSGNVRMRKQHRRNRDDVAQSMVLAALIVARWRRVPVPTGRVWTLAGPTGEQAAV